MYFFNKKMLDHISYHMFYAATPLYTTYAT